MPPLGIEISLGTKRTHSTTIRFVCYLVGFIKENYSATVSLSKCVE